jgi:hypothetical protein
MPIFVLPNVDVRVPIISEFGTVASCDHEWIIQLRRSQPGLDRFLGLFRDQIGNRQRPSVLLISSDSPQYATRSSVAGLRDLLAMAVIPYARSWVLRHDQVGFDVLYANSFEFYPWMMDRHDEGVVIDTPAILTTATLNRFRGQTTPHLSYKEVTRIDEPLLSVLLSRWESRFGTDTPSAEDRKLFRSLNMAYHAAQMPFTSAGVTYDLGRLTGLWISAFEILAHDGARSDFYQVCRILEGRPKRLELPKADDGRTIRRWVYQKLYGLRNDFMHGNETSEEATRVPGTDYDVSHFGAPLYRLLLGEFLDVRRQAPEIDMAREDAVERLMEDRILHREFMQYESSCEEALQRLHDLFAGRAAPSPLFAARQRSTRRRRGPGA